MGHFVFLQTLLSLVIVPYAHGATYNHGSRVDGAIVHYEMSRDECLSGSFSDSASGNLFGNLISESSTSCNDGIGINLMDFNDASVQAQVVSENDATDFLSAVGNSANFTLEFWIDSSIGSGGSDDRPLVTIGTVDDTVDNTCQATGHSHITYGFTVYDRASTGRMFYLYSADIDGVNYCPGVDAPVDTTYSGSHHVISINKGSPNYVAWYVDGEVVVSGDTLGRNFGTLAGSSISELWQVGLPSLTSPLVSSHSSLFIL